MGIAVDNRQMNVTGVSSNIYWQRQYTWFNSRALSWILAWNISLCIFIYEYLYISFWICIMSFFNYGNHCPNTSNAGVSILSRRYSVVYFTSVLPQLSLSHSAVSDSLQSHRVQPTRILCPWNSPGKNTGVGSNCLLQGTFLIQGSNPGLLHCRQILYQLSHQGSPILPQGRVKKLIRLVENDKYWVDQKVLSGLSIANFLANSILCP